MRLLIALLALLLAGCSTFAPTSFEDDLVVWQAPNDAVPEGIFVVKSAPGVVVPPEEVERIRQQYLVEPYYSDRERAAVKTFCVAAALDAITTVVGIGNGCVEKNPLYGSNANVVRVAVPLVAGASCLLLWHNARKSPRVQDLSQGTYIVAGVRFAAVGANLLTGCVK